MQFIIDLSIHADVWKTCTCTNFIKIINSNFNKIALNLMIKWTSDVSDVSYLFLFEGVGFSHLNYLIESWLNVIVTDVQ